MIILLDFIAISANLIAEFDTSCICLGLEDILNHLKHFLDQERLLFEQKSTIMDLAKVD